MTQLPLPRRFAIACAVSYVLSGAAQAQYTQARTSLEWGSYNYSTGRYDIKDGDTLIAPGADIRNIVGHEKGHTMGLGDVYASTNGSDIMYGYTRMGAAPIAISPNDRARATYLYGQ